MSISNQINLHQYNIIDPEKIIFFRSENIQAIKVSYANIKFWFQNKYQVRCQWWKFWWFLTLLSDILSWITAVNTFPIKNTTIIASLGPQPSL